MLRPKPVDIPVKEVPKPIVDEEKKVPADVKTGKK